MAMLAFLAYTGFIGLSFLGVRAVNKAADERMQRIAEEKAKYCPECGAPLHPSKPVLEVHVNTYTPDRYRL